MIYCENREYRCHFCDEDFYYGIGKLNANTNFIGKKKAFLLHLIENHDDSIIDIHEKIPKDEKFKYYNSKPYYSEISNNANNNNLSNINNNNSITDNVEEGKKESEANALAIKEEEKELSFSGKKDLNKPLLPRSNHYFSFLEKMKLFDLPIKMGVEMETSNNTNNNNISNNNNININRILIITIKIQIQI